MNRLEKERERLLRDGDTSTARGYAKLMSLEYDLYVLTKDEKYRFAYDRGNERISA
jgi:hypothetical protein